VETEHLSMREDPFVSEIAGVRRSRMDATRSGAGN
jgi:hypothetical protein